MTVPINTIGDEVPIGTIGGDGDTLGMLGFIPVTLTISGSNAILTISIDSCLVLEYVTEVFNGYLECNKLYLRTKTLVVPDGLELPLCISLRAVE